MSDDDDADPTSDPHSGTPAHRSPEPPVVARLVVEIRSDGSRTIARGAIEDRNLGESAAVEIEAKTPAALARQLMRALLSVRRLGAPRGEPSRRRLPRLARRLNPFRRDKN